MGNEQPNESATEILARRARLAAMLERGGYWRALLRLVPIEDALRLTPGMPVMADWELPRALERYPTKVVQRLLTQHITLLNPAYIVTETTTQSTEGESLTIRLAPLYPEHWEHVQPGDQLAGPRLGVATIIEYVPAPDGA